MRSLIIDVGNTRTKIALFVDGKLEKSELWNGVLPEADNAIVSITGEKPEWLPKGCVELNSRLRLPIELDYDTPETLGSDRIAAASEAWIESGFKPVMVIDAGTCVTVDYVDERGIYRGGAIMPGIDMKFRALHNFTARLPLINIDEVSPDESPIGKSTQGSLTAGVICGTRFALEGYEREYSKRAGKRVEVIVTGGDADKVAGEWRVEEYLVERGMYEILKINVK